MGLYLIFSGLLTTVIPFALELSFLLMKIGYLHERDCKTDLLFLEGWGRERRGGKGVSVPLKTAF